MKILFISPLLPWPLVSGGQVRSYNLIKLLAKNHQVTLVSYYREEAEKKDLSSLEKICEKICLIERKTQPWTARILLKTLFSLKPLVMNLYRTDDYLKDGGKFDLIFCECFYLMDKIFHKKTPLVLSEQNIEYLAYQRYLDNLSFWKKIILWLPMKWDLLKMKFWEKKMWKRADKLAVISKADKGIIEKEIGRKDVLEIPNGVDTKDFILNETPKTKKILFVGTFKWFQNLQAVEWLVKNIYPKIKEELPNSKLLIVGKSAPVWLRKMKAEDIYLDENVEDIRTVYQQADVFLAPLRSGSGTKYKILEAMACGVPVVTTEIGAEGLDKNCMIVKKENTGLAEAVIDVLLCPEKYEPMVKKARRMVEEKFDWQIVGQRLDDLIQSL